MSVGTPAGDQNIARRAPSPGGIGLARSAPAPIDPFGATKVSANMGPVYAALVVSLYKSTNVYVAETPAFGASKTAEAATSSVRRLDCTTRPSFGHPDPETDTPMLKVPK